MNILKVLTPKRMIGNEGEMIAIRYLKKNGYKILEHSYTALGAEIDVIARKKDTLAFIEVKTRSLESLSPKEPRPASSVTAQKQRKIIKTASFYHAHNPSPCRLRFDVIEVYLESKGVRRVKEIKHLENTFDKNTAFSRSGDR